MIIIIIIIIMNITIIIRSSAQQFLKRITRHLSGVFTLVTTFVDTSSRQPIRVYGHILS